MLNSLLSGRVQDVRSTAMASVHYEEPDPAVPAVELFDGRRISGEEEEISNEL